MFTWFLVWEVPLLLKGVGKDTELTPEDILKLCEDAGLPVDCIHIDSLSRTNDGDDLLVEFTHPDAVELPKDMLERLQAVMDSKPEEFNNAKVVKPGIIF